MEISLILESHFSQNCGLYNCMENVLLIGPTDRTRKQHKSSWSSVCENVIVPGVLSDSIRYDSTNSTGFDENGKGGRKVVYVD